MNSLNNRLLVAATVVLVLFFGITGFMLDRIFEENARAAVEDRLEGHVYTLIAATIIGEDKRLHMPEKLSFSHPSSGLYAQAISNDAKKIWRSPSLIEKSFLFRWALPPVTSRFDLAVMPDGQEIFVYSLGVTWDESENIHDGYTFSVAERKEIYDVQIKQFRKKLWGWLAGVAILLLVVQSIILRWGLSPLRRVVEDLQAIESGERKQLQGNYPAELTGLTENLNHLIRNEREHLARYRDTLGNLAHSLKTPLAVLRGEVEAITRKDNSADYNMEKSNEAIQEQIDRMSQIVQYQLQKASTSGRSAVSAHVNVSDIMRKITGALNKVYIEKNIAVEMTIDPGCRFQGDEGDLMEILGNILDNAYKSCHEKIIIRAEVIEKGVAGSRFVLTVDDDGPGIAKDQVDVLLQRGMRGDSKNQGQGIGLAVVSDILQIYSGLLEIQRSALGGARVLITIPL